MSEPICADCGQPIEGPYYDLMCGGIVRHESLRECLGVLKRALSSAEADRDRYRALLAAMWDADRALSAAAKEVNKARGLFAGDGALGRARAALDDAEDARNAAVDAALAAVEEDEG